MTRAAFLYLEPKGDEGDFAQCGECRLFVPGEGRCAIHGPDVEIDADDSCGFFIVGKPSDDQSVYAAVTPEESGLVRSRVQCWRCEFAKAGARHCGLFAKLNRLPEFGLDVDIEPHACCNAWVARKPAMADRRYEGRA